MRRVPLPRHYTPANLFCDITATAERHRSNLYNWCPNEAERIHHADGTLVVRMALKPQENTAKEDPAHMTRTHPETLGNTPSH